jgi:hypothetical protein
MASISAPEITETPLIFSLHCEKSLFVLASRQKSYGWKIPARNNRYCRKIPAFWSLEGDFIHSRPENPGR